MANNILLKYIYTPNTVNALPNTTLPVGDFSIAAISYPNLVNLRDFHSSINELVFSIGTIQVGSTPIRRRITVPISPNRVTFARSFNAALQAVTELTFMIVELGPNGYQLRNRGPTNVSVIMENSNELYRTFWLGEKNELSTENLVVDDVIPFDVNPSLGISHIQLKIASLTLFLPVLEDLNCYGLINYNRRIRISYSTILNNTLSLQVYVPGLDKTFLLSSSRDNAVLLTIER